MNLSDYSLITCCFFYCRPVLSCSGSSQGYACLSFCFFAPSKFFVACADQYFSVFRLERLQCSGSTCSCLYMTSTYEWISWYQRPIAELSESFSLLIELVFTKRHFTASLLAPGVLLEAWTALCWLSKITKHYNCLMVKLMNTVSEIQLNTRTCILSWHKGEQTYNGPTCSRMSREKADLLNKREQTVCYVERSTLSYLVIYRAVEHSNLSDNL